MRNKPNRIYYLFFKILGLALFVVPFFFKGQGILTELSKLTVIILIILGVILIITGDILERKYKKQTNEVNLK